MQCSQDGHQLRTWQMHWQSLTHIYSANVADLCDACGHGSTALRYAWPSDAQADGFQHVLHNSADVG